MAEGGQFAVQVLFDTDDPEFRRGVEVGMLWQACREHPVVSLLIHGDNAEMAIRIAEAFGRPFSSLDGGGEFIDVTIGEGPPMRSDPREPLGRIVRMAWVAWAREQPDPKPSWLVGWEDLDPGQREVDMRIGQAVANAVRGWLETDVQIRAEDLAALDRLVAARQAEISDLNALIAGLRQFEREYRIELCAYHQHKIDTLNGAGDRV